MDKSESIPVLSVSGLSSPPAWRALRNSSQNPVTPSNTPVITGVFAKHANLKSLAQNASTNENGSGSAAEDEVTEKMKKLGQ